MLQSDFDKYYKNYLTLRWAGGDLTDEEKKLRNAFDSKTLMLRWHLTENNVQVWDRDIKGPYCICTFDGTFQAGTRAIHILKERQKTARELKFAYLNSLEDLKTGQKKKRRSVAEEMSRQTTKFARGRVTSTAGKYSKLEI